MSTTQTMKTFKSDRAAKTAFTKAEHAYDYAKRTGTIARDEINMTMREFGRMDHDKHDALETIETQAKAEAKVLFEKMREIYDAAKVQGFELWSLGARWHFGQNATRDLIAQNID